MSDKKIAEEKAVEKEIKENVTAPQARKILQTKPEPIDISDFFVTARENGGLWFEPLVDGFPSGIELKVLGRSSSKVIRAGAEYLKAVESLKEIQDDGERVEAERRIVCHRIAQSVIGIRGKGGRPLLLKGKPVQYSQKLIEDLLVENMDIRTEVLEFSSDSSNYIKK